MSNKVFLIDYDNTLVDNELIKESISKSLILELGAEQTKLFWGTYRDIAQEIGFIDFEAFTLNFTNSTEITNKILCDDNLKADPYPKVHETLKWLSTKGKIYLYTEGGINYQKRKIELSGVLTYVTDVFYFNSKMKYLNTIFSTFDTDNLVYIEDKPTYLLKAEELFPHITTILVKQGKYADATTPEQENKIDYVVNNFYEIKDLPLGL